MRFVGDIGNRSGVQYPPRTLGVFFSHRFIWEEKTHSIVITLRKILRRTTED